MHTSFRTQNPFAGLALLFGCALVCGACTPTGANTGTTDVPSVPDAYVQAASPVEAGRYLAIVGGCNDCHTAGYLQTEGNVPESEWLKGSPVGFRGPWGTTYPSNLRLLVQEMPEQAFVDMVHTRKAMPPMPWMNVNQMAEADVRALYRYIASLGPAGERMPAPVPPDQEPATPYIDMVPRHMERLPAPPAEGASGEER